MRHFHGVAPVVRAAVRDELRGRQASERVGRQGRGVLGLAGKASRHALGRLPGEHREIAGGSTGRQRILEGALELPGVRVLEDVIDHGAGPRPLDGGAHVQADQLEAVAVADIDAGDRRPLRSRDARPAVWCQPSRGEGIELGLHELQLVGRFLVGGLVDAFVDVEEVQLVARTAFSLTSLSSRTAFSRS